jgi:hypothetical protein
VFKEPIFVSKKHSIKETLFKGKKPILESDGLFIQSFYQKSLMKNVRHRNWHVFYCKTFHMI